MNPGMCALLVGLASGAALAAERPALPRRVVCLGDSITDGHTYPLLVGQAMREAGIAPPVFMNAGVGGDTAQGMRSRLERDVLPLHPDCVMLSAGVNDAATGVSPESYAADVTAMADRLAEHGIALMLFTPTAVRASAGDDPAGHAQLGRLDAYNGFLRSFAAARGLRLAELYAPMVRAARAGADLWEADGGHLNFAGYRVMARGVLDGLGLAEVPVPEALVVAPARGLVREWRVRSVPPGDARLGDEEAARLEPDASWARIELPLAEPGENWWWDQERQRGFALKLERYAGPGPRYLAAARLDVPADCARQINLGAHVSRVWLNGAPVFVHPDGVVSGWRAGKFRIPVKLKSGANRLLIETGNAFFVNVTEDDDW